MKLRVLAMLLVFMMTLSLVAGCGNSEQVAETSSNAAASESSSASSETQAPEEIANISVMILSLGPQGEGAVEVEKKLNEITEKEINTHVTLKYVEPGQYTQQINLAIAGDEDLDAIMVTPIPPAGFSALTASNSLVPLNDLLATYGQDVLGIVGDYIKGTTINGNIYALPNYRDLSSGAYIVMRKDLLEQANLLDKAEAMTTWTEYEDIMKQISEQFKINGTGPNDAEGSIINIANVWLDDDKFADSESFDSLGDNYKIIATDESGKVINYYKSDKYKVMIDRVRKWNQEGLIYKDSATNKELVDTLLKNDVYFSATINGELGVEVNHGSASGKELIAKKVVGITTGTSNVTKFGWAIPVCSKEQEAAAKFLNLMFKSPEVNNLLAWGIEGKDYVVENGFAKFPEGVTRETVAYHTADFLYGNQFLTTPWEGSPENIREIAKKEMAEGGISKYLGFSCDTTKVENELTAVNSVINEYKAGLHTGMLGQGEYDKFIAKLDAAGIEKIVAEYQTQLDAWLATQK